MKDVNVERFEKGPKADAIHFEATSIPEPPVKANIPMPPAEEKDTLTRMRANGDARTGTTGQEQKKSPAETDVGKEAVAAMRQAQAIEQEELVLELRKAIKEGTVNNQGIRFSQREADDLRDVGYAIATQHKYKLSKNDMIRLGLDYLVAEYRRRGEESVLVQFVVAKRDLV